MPWGTVAVHRYFAPDRRSQDYFAGQARVSCARGWRVRVFRWGWGRRGGIGSGHRAADEGVTSGSHRWPEGPEGPLAISREILTEFAKTPLRFAGCLGVPSAPSSHLCNAKRPDPRGLTTQNCPSAPPLLPPIHPFSRHPHCHRPIVSPLFPSEALPLPSTVRRPVYFYLLYYKFFFLRNSYETEPLLPPPSSSPQHLKTGDTVWC